MGGEDVVGVGVAADVGGENMVFREVRYHKGPFDVGVE